MDKLNMIKKFNLAKNKVIKIKVKDAYKIISDGFKGCEYDHEDHSKIVTLRMLEHLQELRKK